MNFVHRIVMQREEKRFVHVITIQQGGTAYERSSRRDGRQQRQKQRNGWPNFENATKRGSFGRSADFGGGMAAPPLPLQARARMNPQPSLPTGSVGDDGFEDISWSSRVHPVAENVIETENKGF